MFVHCFSEATASFWNRCLDSEKSLYVKWFFSRPNVTASDGDAQFDKTARAPESTPSRGSCPSDLDLTVHLAHMDSICSLALSPLGSSSLSVCVTSADAKQHLVGLFTIICPDSIFEV